FPHSRVAKALNSWILRLSLAALRRRIGMRDFQLWVFIPTAAPYVGKLGESLVVYYVTDEYSQFGYVSAEQVAENDRQLTRQADVVFATAQSLVEKRRTLNPGTYLARHGVDHELFAAALQNSTTIPDDIASIPRPIIGFHGALQHWLDYDLIERLARRHPEWSIVLIGRPVIDVSCLQNLSNVHLLGRKRHDELPGYCKAMSVALIPHKVCELTRHMNPIKLREYLCSGLPVVSVDLPEVQAYSKFCRIARNYQEFEAAIQDSLNDDSPAARQERSDAMRPETWERRVADLGVTVMKVHAERVAAK